MEPTILTGVTDTMQCARTETFGPLVSVYPFMSDDEAVALAAGAPIGLLATFAAPWLVLVVRPYSGMAHLAPVAYDEEAGDETKGFFPPTRSADQARGQLIYLQQGCVQCHTQVIRPQYLGGDGDEFKRNWGEAQNK